MFLFLGFDLAFALRLSFLVPFLPPLSQAFLSLLLSTFSSCSGLSFSSSHHQQEESQRCKVHLSSFKNPLLHFMFRRATQRGWKRFALPQSSFLLFPSRSFATQPSDLFDPILLPLVKPFVTPARLSLFDDPLKWELTEPHEQEQQAVLKQFFPLTGKPWPTFVKSAQENAGFDFRFQNPIRPAWDAVKLNKQRLVLMPGCTGSGKVCSLFSALFLSVLFILSALPLSPSSSAFSYPLPAPLPSAFPLPFSLPPLLFPCFSFTDHLHLPPCSSEASHLLCLPQIFRRSFRRPCPMPDGHSFSPLASNIRSQSQFRECCSIDANSIHIVARMLLFRWARATQNVPQDNFSWFLQLQLNNGGAVCFSLFFPLLYFFIFSRTLPKSYL
jgi:hypothetical protein